MTKTILKQLCDDAIAANDRARVAAYSRLLNEIRYLEEAGEEINIPDVLEHQINQLSHDIEFRIEMGYQESALRGARELDILLELALQVGAEN